jgi:hypothetical protein
MTDDEITRASLMYNHVVSLSFFYTALQPNSATSQHSTNARDSKALHSATAKDVKVLHSPATGTAKLPPALGNSQPGIQPTKPDLSNVLLSPYFLPAEHQVALACWPMPSRLRCNELLIMSSKECGICARAHARRSVYAAFFI